MGGVSEFVEDVDDEGGETVGGGVGGTVSDYTQKCVRKRSNEIEHNTLKLKTFRRIFTRYDNLDTMFLDFLPIAMFYTVLCKHILTKKRRNFVEFGRVLLDKEFLSGIFYSKHG